MKVIVWRVLCNLWDYRDCIVYLGNGNVKDYWK